MFDDTSTINSPIVAKTTGRHRDIHFYFSLPFLIAPCAVKVCHVWFQVAICANLDSVRILLLLLVKVHLNCKAQISKFNPT